MGKPLTGKVVVITGAARRIGAVIAHHLHREGMNVVLHYHRSANEAKQLAQVLEAERPGSVTLAR